MRPVVAQKIESPQSSGPLRGPFFPIAYLCFVSFDSVICLTWFKVPIKNIKSESGAELLRLVSMHAGKAPNWFAQLTS